MSPTPGNSSPTSGRGQDPYAAFRIHAYRAYTIGWFVSTLGLRVQSVAIAWEMYQRTGDPLSLGLVGLAQALPTMLFAIPSGYLADRYSRIKLIVFSVILMVMTSSALAVLSYREGSISLMYLLLFLDAAAAIVGRPARVALLPQMIPPEVFPNAVMWNTSMMQFTSVVGPAIGGFVVAWNVTAAYVIAAGGSLLYLLLIAGLHVPEGPKVASGAPLKALAAGLHFVWNTRIILTMISLDMFAVLLGGAVYLLPVFASDILHVGAGGFGWLRAAPAIGALILGVTMVYLPPIKRAGSTLLWCIAGFGVATIIFGLTESYWVSFFMLALTGAFDNVSMVIRQTLVQRLTPNEMRGRVSAVEAIFVGASNELGGLESGLVAHWFGPVFSAVSGGIGTILVVITAAWSSSQLRNYGPLVEEMEPIELAPSTPVNTNAPISASDD